MNSRMTPAEAHRALRKMTSAEFVTADNSEVLNAAGEPMTDEDVDQLIDEAHRAAGRPSLTSPGRHSPQLTVRLPEPVYEQLGGLSARTGKRRTEIVREALIEYLKSA